MTIHLAADVEAQIREKLTSGRFLSADEVVREAMRLLDEQDRRLAPLRAKLQVGIDELERGEGVEWTPALRDQLRKEADEMYRRGEQSDPDVRSAVKRHYPTPLRKRLGSPGRETPGRSERPSLDPRRLRDHGQGSRSRVIGGA